MVGHDDDRDARKPLVSLNLRVPALARGDGSSALIKGFARERVEELEMRRARGERSVDAQIEQLGLDFRSRRG